MISELQNALSSAGFPLPKWTSSKKAVLKHIPNGHLIHIDFFDIEEVSTTKTLGIRWKATSDEFYFVIPPIAYQPTYTKREVLAHIAKLFDPAGWHSPFVVQAKMFMQQLWLQELHWDDCLPDDFLQKWRDFL